MKNNTYAVPFIFYTLLVFAAGYVFGARMQCSSWKTETVERGHAEWVTESNGDTTWRWKVPAKIKKDKE